MDEEIKTPPQKRMTTAPSFETKRPIEWATAKGLAKLNADGSLNFKSHKPWEFEAARVACKWPDAAIDPTFTLTESEFDAAIAAVRAVTLG